MAKSVLDTIANVPDFERLESLEANILRMEALTPDIEKAIKTKYAQLGRAVIAARTGLNLEELTPAEERIIEATARYVGLRKRDGKSANRTLQMLANRGLIEAAEFCVSRITPTQGFEVLEEADLSVLSFEQIIVDHPEEFSPRARWYARQTLGLPNESDKPPASGNLITQIRTEDLIDWLAKRASEHDGDLTGYTNSTVGAVLGFEDLSIHGRVLGNITSRLDFACFRCGLPPLGLVADVAFANAWNREDRTWEFPVPSMAAAAKTRRWSAQDFRAILERTQELPGTASISWEQALRENEASIKDWAFGLKSEGQMSKMPAAHPLSVELGHVAELERKALQEALKEKLKTGLQIERGPIGAAVKKLNGYRCQICAEFGLEAHAFKKKDGTPYVEAHHVMPVSERQVGSLAASNVMTLCANHHRQMHYGDVSVEILATTFEIRLGDRAVSIPRLSLV
jgi:hypothetical protein